MNTLIILGCISPLNSSTDFCTVLPDALKSPIDMIPGVMSSFLHDSICSSPACKYDQKFFDLYGLI